MTMFEEIRIELDADSGRMRVEDRKWDGDGSPAAGS